MRPKQPRNKGDVEAEIAALSGLQHGELIKLWINHYSNPPPKPVSRKLLIRAIAYAIQVKHYGGLPKRLRRELLRIAQESRLSAKIDHAPLRRTLSPGTRLLRDWHGHSHSVEVTDHGFLWNGHAYRSLSVIAREITGSNRNGPKFFGL
jgi:DUF2924 family protein